MISHLTGTVTAVGPTWVVLDLAGFGLKASCTPATSAAVRLGAATTLHTSLVVRQDSLTLFGFAEADERDCFDLVQSASGVGPKLAQALVSVLSPDDLRRAITAEDLVSLCKVPGIGRKGAQKLVLELKDKILTLGAVSSPEPAGGSKAASDAWREQVADGLQGLGWSPRDADAACDAVAPLVEDDPTLSVAVLMRAALRSLARP